MSNNNRAVELKEKVGRLLREENDATYAAILDAILTHFGCQVGTIHFLDDHDGKLKLAAQKGVPESILNRVQMIPVGKGMAGLAAQRGEPVQICNLQSDESGQAKTGARSTQMEGSISLPMMLEDRVRGVLGVAKPEVYEYSQEEIDLLLELGRLIARQATNKTSESSFS